MRQWETHGLIDRLFGGSPGTFINAFFEQENLTDKELSEIRKIIDEGEQE